jgi:serine protease
MIRPLAAAALLGALAGLVAVQPAAAGSLGHSRLVPLPTVLPPPASGRPMRWASVPPVARTHLTAASFAGGRAVVGLAGGVAGRAFAGSLGLRLTTALPGLRAVEVAGSPRALAALAARADSRVRYVEPVKRLEQAHRRDDPLTWQVDPKTGRPYQWAFHQVGADQALNVAKGDPRILVGVVDSGVAPVANLRGKVAETFWDRDRNNSAADVVGHGTFVSSIIAARNDDGVGLAGLCGACRVAVFKAIPLDDVQLALGIQRLTDAHVRIINLSVISRTVSQNMIDALNYAQRAGVLVVAASGNEGSGTIDFPASYIQPPNGETAPALSVGAVDVGNRRAAFSNWGSQLSLVAPGALDTRCRFGIIGALPPVATDFDTGGACQSVLGELGGNRYAYASGTSFAAPEVSGIAALVWSVRPELTAFQVASVLQSTATRRPDADWTPQLGWGVVNARAAVELVSGKTTNDSLRLTGLRVLGRRAPGATLTARVRASWGDGLPVVGGATPRCRITLGGRAIATKRSLTDGVLSCSFTLGPGSGGAHLEGSLRITAPATPTATTSFELTVTRPSP